MRDAVVPNWLKIAYTLWFFVWVPVYYFQAGPANFLWLCDIGNAVILIAMWTGSRALFSSQAVGVLLIQSFWILDVLGRLVLGFHPVGGTEYMFDPAEPVLVRFLSLFHLWIPILLLWTVYRFGMDPKGWKVQTLISWMILPLSSLTDPALNINWLQGPFGVRQTLMPDALYMVLCLVLYPLVLFRPTQWALDAWARRLARRRGSRI